MEEIKLQPRAHIENKSRLEVLERVFQHVGDDSVVQEGEEGPEVAYGPQAALSNMVAAGTNMVACDYLNLNHLKINKI